MKKAIKYILLISITISCQTQQECSDIGCQIVVKVKAKKEKQTFFNKKKKNKIRKKPKKGLFKKRVFKQESGHGF